MRNPCGFNVRLAFAVFVFSTASAFAQTTIFSDGFEGTFPGSWTVGNDGGITTAKWGDNSAKASAGSWSAFCADNGSDTRTVYDNNLKTYMQRQGVSLAGYTTATLNFKYWLNTESGYDFFYVNIRDQNGTWHAPEFKVSGNQNSLGWQSKAVSLDAYAGQTGLYIQFLFTSDGATVNASPSGVWVDEVSLVASASGGLTVAVQNVNGATVTGALVSRYNSAYTYLDQKTSTASWTGIPTGTYNLEAYFTGTFWGSEFWASDSAVVNAGTTTAKTLLRKYPYSSGVVISNVTSGGIISAGQSIPAGTQVRAYVTVRNDVGTALNSEVRFLFDISQSSSYDYDSGLSASQSIPGSGGTRTFTFTFTPSTTGQYYYALQVQTYVNTSYIPTDSWTWTQTFNAIPNTGTVTATLKNVGGANATASGTRFVLYTSPQRQTNGFNPATFSSVSSGTYLLEGYQTGTFWGEEFWNSQQFAVAAGATTNAVLTRKYPYATSVVMKNVETGATITAGQTIPAGTQVRFEVTVRNDVPGTPLSTQVHFVLDFSQGAPFDYDWPLSAAQVIAGSGGTALYTFTTALNGFQTGQFYFALQVRTDTGTSVVPTDSWTWTQACGTERTNKISGLVAPPDLDAQAYGWTSTHTFMQLYPVGTTARIDPNLRSWIIIHGPSGSSTNQWVVDLAGAIAAVYPTDQILLLDWTEAADSGIAGTIEEDWIKPVAAWAAGKLVDYGFAGIHLNLIGHSWGGNMTDELAELISGGVNTIVALDPAHDGDGSYNPEDPGQIDFRAHSQFSWAFHSSLLGSSVTPTNADEAFIVDTGLSLVIGLPGEVIAHSAVHDLFTYMITNGSGGVSSKFQLSRLLAHQPGPWMQNLFTTSFNQGWPYIETPTIGYEGIIQAASGGLSPYAIFYTNSSLMPVVTHEYVEVIPPTISAFSASPNTVTLGNAFTISYTVADSGGSGLNRVVLRRTAGNGSINDPGWQAIETNTVTGNGPVNGNFTDTPPSAGTYWYGMAVFDNANNSNDERAAGLGPLQRIVTTPADTTPPALTITSPANGAVVTSASLSVSGTASDSGFGNNGISSVTANGVSASGGTASGSGTANWNATNMLNAGVNTITVVAKDTLNNSTQKVVSVTYNPPRPIFASSSVSGGQLRTTLSGLSVGETVVLQVSTDLKNWTPTQTKVASGLTLTFTSTVNSAMKVQYFRVVVQ